MEVSKKLEVIAADLRGGGAVPPITVREFLSWFNAQRRGSFIVWLIREKMAEAGLTTEPNFESAYIDSEIKFALAPEQSAEEDLPGNAMTDERPTHNEDEQDADPTYRLSRLEAANRAPVSLPPTASIAQAVTLMGTYDFSQLPVMTTERDVKGVISWNSIGMRFGLGQAPREVREAMDDYHEISVDASLFQAIPIIVQNQYVLVRGKDKRVVGIITASDLSLQFQQLSEPFLLIGEIENHLRSFIGRVFSVEELSSLRQEMGETGGVGSVNDLTFGEYLRLIGNPVRWDKLGLGIDREVFCNDLGRIRLIRNDVMHFDPDGIPPGDLELLRQVVAFLRRLADIGCVPKLGR